MRKIKERLSANGNKRDWLYLILDDPHEQAELALDWADQRLDITDMGRVTTTGHFLSKTWIGRSDLKTLQDLKAMYAKPWPEGMARYEDFLKELKASGLPTPRDIRRRCGWRPDEGELDLDRFQAGDDPWRGPLKRLIMGQQYVTVAIQVGGNAHMSAESLQWRGVAAAALVEALEGYGYGVDVLAFNIVDGLFTHDAPHKGCMTLSATWVKKCQEHLDPVLLVNATSPWWFRTLDFLTWTTLGKCTSHLGHQVGFMNSKAGKAPLQLVADVPDERLLWVVADVYNKEAAIGQSRKFLTDLITSVGEPAS